MMAIPFANGVPFASSFPYPQWNKCFDYIQITFQEVNRKVLIEIKQDKVTVVITTSNELKIKEFSVCVRERERERAPGGQDCICHVKKTKSQWMDFLTQ